MAPRATPTETVMKLTDTKQQLSQVINRVARGETRVVVEKSGLPVAVIISTDEYRRFKEQEEARKARRVEMHALFSEISMAFKDVPQVERDRKVEKAIALARAELRAEREGSNHA